MPTADQGGGNAAIPVILVLLAVAALGLGFFGYRRYLARKSSDRRRMLGPSVSSSTVGFPPIGGEVSGYQTDYCAPIPTPLNTGTAPPMTTLPPTASNA